MHMWVGCSIAPPGLYVYGSNTRDCCICLIGQFIPAIKPWLGRHILTHVSILLVHVLHTAAGQVVDEGQVVNRLASVSASLVVLEMCHDTISCVHVNLYLHIFSVCRVIGPAAENAVANVVCQIFFSACINTCGSLRAGKSMCHENTAKPLHT